ncbi:hypothetical protein AB0L06_41890 [Spirillospora sp. NPDC052269]
MTTPSGNTADPFTQHRIRIITLSKAGEITSDVLQPWNSVSVTNTHTSESPGFPAAEIPSGVLHRTADGREILLTVDGIRLELDGHGSATAHDDLGEISGPGIFMVVEVLPPDPS